MSGTYSPGSKLPFQAELAQSFQVSGLTIQQAMHRLAREGFVVARRRIGTVVVSKLPHLHNLAFILPQDPLNTDFFSRFFTVLSNAARYLQDKQDRPIRVFHNINRHSDVEDRQQLLDLINAEEHGLAVVAHKIMDLTKVLGRTEALPGGSRAAAPEAAAVPGGFGYQRPGAWELPAVEPRTRPGRSG